MDRNSNLYIADQGAHRVRKIDPSGNISTYAGNGSQGFSGDGGPAIAASLNNPTALAADAAGNLYITDQFNHRIRKITGIAASSGPITTSAGVTNGASFQTGIRPAASSPSSAPAWAPRPDK